MLAVDGVDAYNDGLILTLVVELTADQLPAIQMDMGNSRDTIKCEWAPLEGEAELEQELHRFISDGAVPFMYR